VEALHLTKYKYTVTFESEHDIDNPEQFDCIDIVEPSTERGLINADNKGVASWWYGNPSYAIEWKIIKKEVIK